MNQCAHDQRIEHCDDRGFSWGEDASVNAAEDDDRHQQGPAGTPGRTHHPESTLSIVLAPTLVSAVQVNEQHEDAANQQARSYAGNEEFAYRDLGGYPEEDHWDRRRNDDAQLG